MHAQDPGPSRRTVVAATALAGAGLALAGPGVAFAAQRETVLRSRELEVRVDPDFPRIVSYTDRMRRRRPARPGGPGHLGADRRDRPHPTGDLTLRP